MKWIPLSFARTWRRPLRWLAVFLLGCFVLSSYFLVITHQSLTESGENRYQSFLLADELRQSSDDLTRMARTFAATGLKRYEDQFWAVLAIRNGERARPKGYNRIYWDFLANTDKLPYGQGEKRSLREMMVERGIAENELALLQKAQDNSDALVMLEEVALRAVNNRLTAEDEQYRESGESNRDMALRLLHGEAYHAAKAAIMEPINLFLAAVDQRTNREFHALAERASSLIRLTSILVALAVLAALATRVCRLRIDAHERALLNDARNRTERANVMLAEGEKRFRDFAEASSDWFWEMGPDLRFTYFSDRVHEVLGSAPSVFIGKTREEISQEDVASRKWREHLETLQRREPFKDFQYPRTGPNGNLQHLSVSGVPVFGKDGSFLGYRGTTKDVTKQRATEVDRDTARDKAEEASRAKSEFLANMSHELRTPLNSIIGFSDIIAGQHFGDIENPRYVEYAADIQGSAQHLLAVISDILDISRIEAGEVTLNETFVDVAEVVHDSLRLIRGLRQPGERELEVSIPDSLPNLLADPKLIRQILVNLLQNAVKFTSDDGRVSVRAIRKASGGIKLSITDTGIGMTPEETKTALEPFGQIRHDALRTHEGTGLGLPIAKKLTELHDGQLHIDSKRGVGTTVHTEFPANRTQPI